MARNEGEKPLPNIPSHTRLSQLQLTTLTVEGHARLHRFISQALEEQSDTGSIAWSVDDRNTWADRIEGALHDLGASIARGGWLSGMKRARLYMKKFDDAEEALQEEGRLRNKRQKEDEETLKQNAKSKSSRMGGNANTTVENTRNSVHSEVKMPSTEDVHGHALREMRELISRTNPPSPRPSMAHFLLTVAGYGSSTALPSQDTTLDSLVSSPVECTFTANVFALPDGVSNEPNGGNIVLYGLNEWRSNHLSIFSDQNFRIVGGSFQLKGASSPAQHAVLLRLLRLSVFMYLSILLEQHFLANSRVELRFRKPAIPAIVSVPLGERSISNVETHPRGKRDGSLSSGIWSFFSKKTEHLLNRAVGVAPSIVRTGSLEVSSSRKRQAQGSHLFNPDDNTPRRPRRFSFISPLSAGDAHDKANTPVEHPLSAAVKRLEKWQDLLSTSPSITFSPPTILLALAEREKRDPSRRLTGDEKAALTSILGWEGRDAETRVIAGTPGFVRHQGFSALYSEHIINGTPPPATPNTSQPSTSSSNRLLYCGNRRKWVTYRFYNREKGHDETLGDFVTRVCSSALDPCKTPGCQHLRVQHELRWIHAGTRIIANIAVPEGSDVSRSKEVETLQMWQSCATCGRCSKRTDMLDGTYLLSFSKYLELLVYSQALLSSPPLCEHTALPARPWPDGDAPITRVRQNICRNFSYKERTLTFTLSTIEDVFEVRVPRLQIVRHRNTEQTEKTDARMSTEQPDLSMEDDRKRLRREITQWWQGLSDHIDGLERALSSEDLTTHLKALPRLPSEDGDFVVYEGDGATTPKRHPIDEPTITQTVKTIPVHHDSDPFPPPSHTDEKSSNTTTSSLSSQSNTTESIHRLSGLRHTFQRTEQNLYAELSRTPSATLNDVRRSFVTAARGASRRLAAWEAKHTPHTHKADPLVGIPIMEEPEWWKSSCHAVPGGKFVVREDDWGSIIAFTLSSTDYHRELVNMAVPQPNAPPVPPTTIPAHLRPSFFTGASFKRLMASSAPTPDPDQDDVVWQEPETYSAIITRKEHPRDPTALSSLREVLRQKTALDPNVLSSASKFFPVGSSTRAVSGGVPASAWAKPAVEVSTQAAGGHLSGTSDAVGAAGKILHGLEETSSTSSTAGSRQESLSDSQVSASSFVETNIRRGKTSSIISSDSDSTIDADSQKSASGAPPPPPPKDACGSAESAAGTPRPASPSGITASLTNTLASAMRYMLKPGEGEEQRPAQTPNHHALLQVDTPTIDERPHIKYEWTIGKRLKFSCTVYYARQFDALRRRCGIEDTFVRSLARSENWAAEGGKSKSNFWKTADDQYIIKTLVNAWNVADLQVLIELGPSYFRYMDATASRPSVLAKLLGFYTVEIKNLESGATQAKADLLVMENLFYDQKITKTFDLKGIQGRKVKASSNNGSSSKTLFDGEWIEGQQRALTLVCPYSKVVLQDAIKADCEFLARSNIMDYSLLVGIDEEHKKIACGLVDTIGSYTFAKTLEYKAKQGLNAGKEVTVIPPQEYQERFVNAMDDYFLACPDKWSRPLDDTKIPSDCWDLPSIL